MNDIIQRHLKETLLLPDDAVQWLLMLYKVTQVFDDFADGDAVERCDLDAAIWESLVAMPSNTFFQRNQSVLLPVMANSVLKWKASDTAELNNEADERSFVWRASYYDVVLAVFQLCHGASAAMENAHIIMKLYGEAYQEYVEEFSNA